MPLDIVGVIEGVFQALNLLPSGYEARYERRVRACTEGLTTSLTAWLTTPSNAQDRQQYEKFKISADELARLVSNPPGPDNPVHKALKDLLLCVLSAGQALQTGALSVPQAQEVLAAIHRAVSTAQPSR